MSARHAFKRRRISLNVCIAFCAMHGVFALDRFAAAKADFSLPFTRYSCSELALISRLIHTVGGLWNADICRRLLTWIFKLGVWDRISGYDRVRTVKPGVQAGGRLLPQKSPKTWDTIINQGCTTIWHTNPSGVYVSFWGVILMGCRKSLIGRLGDWLTYCAPLRSGFRGIVNTNADYRMRGGHGIRLVYPINALRVTCRTDLACTHSQQLASTQCDYTSSVQFFFRLAEAKNRYKHVTTWQIGCRQMSYDTGFVVISNLTYSRITNYSKTSL